MHFKFKTSRQALCDIISRVASLVVALSHFSFPSQIYNFATNTLACFDVSIFCRKWLGLSLYCESATNKYSKRPKRPSINYVMLKFVFLFSLPCPM